MERSRSSYEVHVVYENYLIISMKNKSPVCSCWLGRNIFFLIVPRKAVSSIRHSKTLIQAVVYFYCFEKLHSYTNNGNKGKEERFTKEVG